MRNALHFSRSLWAAIVLCGMAAVATAQQPDLVREPYRLDTGLISRSISFETPTGAPGEGGQASSNLGPGRKGMPARNIEPGQSIQLCDIEGPGTIRHIWVTCHHDPIAMRSFVIRAWYDGQEHPSIECPVGDFFGTSVGKVMPYANQKNFVSMYRWHLADPIAWQKEGRVTIQQIACKNGLLETQDNWSCATFWYEPVPSAPLPAMPDVKARTADLWKDEPKK